MASTSFEKGKGRNPEYFEDYLHILTANAVFLTSIFSFSGSPYAQLGSPHPVPFIVLQ
jgi:hypothetical protein